MKKNIKPHKGGRSEIVIARVTKEEKQLIWSKKGKLSFSDWIVDKAKQKKGI